MKNHSNKKITVVSLFSGCGGLDLGFKQAGADVIFHNEFDKKITPTLEANFQGKINTCNIKDLNIEDIPKSDIIIGGPPCQSFSIAGKGLGIKDERGQLIYYFSNIVVKKKPKAFLMENVSGLSSNKHREAFNSLLKAFESGGYNIYWKALDAYDYGVPQNRKRLFIVGLRKDIKKMYKFPDPLNVKDRKDLTIIKNTVSKHTYKGGFSSIFMSRNRVRHWNQPSFTIQASARQIPLHPSCIMKKIRTDIFEIVSTPRRLSVEECAKIQTFPDNFKFIFSRLEDAYKMIGNAVPTLIANKIAEKIINSLIN